MKANTMKWIPLVSTMAILLLVGGCKKKVEAPPPPPPPPSVPAPSASLAANPNVIEKGASTTLTWRTERATEVTLDGIGAVEPSGSRSVTPNSSITYRLEAKGPGGSQEATARVTVTEPAPAPVTPGPTDEQLFAQNVRDVFFDYDKYDVRPDADAQLSANARFLAQHPGIRFVIEGHCDERGSIEYNLALGDNRANATKDALVRMGVGADRIRTVSWGKEKPFCTQSNEDCWQQNRRGHFVYQK
ncbi:MAG: peptidoglycan-associated lipoprotein Pal [Terriglobales bacterium]